MTTIAQGASATVTLGIGETVSIATNGGRWWATETPVVGSVVGPASHLVQTHRTFGPYTGGGTVVLTNQSVDTMVYVQTAAGVTSAPVITAVGATSTVTLGDQGTLAVSNTNGFWSVIITPVIGAASTRIIGPQASNTVFGPYPGGASITLANQTGSNLVSVARNSASGAIQPLRFASPTNVYPTGTPITAAGTQLTIRVRMPLIVGSADASSLCVSLATRRININTISATGNPVTISRMSIGLDGETVGYPLTFSGSRSATIPDGTYFFDSDEFVPSLFTSLAGQTKFVRGTFLWCQFDMQVTAAGMVWPNANALYAGASTALALIIDPATFDGTFDVDNFSTRTLGSIGRTATTTCPMPMLCARYVSGDPPVVAGFGDSLTLGQAGSGNPITTTALTIGGFQRALCATKVAASTAIGGIKFAQGGTTLSWLLSAPGQALMAAAGPRATHMLLGFGANEWLASPGTVVATAEASYLSAIGYWYASDPAKRVRSVIARRLTPRNGYTHTTSSCTNVGTTATFAGVDTLIPGVGTTVTVAGVTPAAYNGTFTVLTASAGSFTVTLLSDPGGSATVQGTWNDAGVTSGSQAPLNNCWAKIGTDPIGRARQFNNWLDTQIADAKLLQVADLATNRGSATLASDLFYQWATANPPLSADGTHESDTGYTNEASDYRTIFTALV